MITSIRYLLFSCIATVCLYSGWRSYLYFFDTQAPDLIISGIEDGSYYAGDIPCVITMKDRVRVKELSIVLDDKPLVTHHRVDKKQADYTFTIPTAALPHGKHELRCEAIDASYRKNRTIESVTFIADNLPLQAAFVRSDADLKLFQGKTLHLMFQVSKPIKQATLQALGRTAIAVPEDQGSLVYEAFIPIACEDRPNEYPLTIEITDYVGNIITLETKFQVIPFPFNQQKLVLKPEDIEAERLAGADERELEDALAHLTPLSPPKKLWHGSFYEPIDVKRISTPFGAVRLTQHRGKYMHRAVDLVGEPRRVVWAPQDGNIIIKKRFAHSGNTIAIDHGCGIITLYFHLDSFGSYEVGDMVRQGNPLGTIGKTGFANGYHLHWELRINNIAVDPMQWIRQDF